MWLQRNSPRILCVARSIVQLERMFHAMKASGYQTVLASSADQGVAVCVGDPLAAVMIDAALCSDGDSSLPKDFKLVKPSIPVLLLDGRSEHLSNALPEGIDAVVNPNSPEDVLAKLKQLLAFRSATGT